MNFNEQERRPKWFLFLHNTPEFFFKKINSVNSYSTDCTFIIVTADSKVVYSRKSWKPYKPIY